MFIKEISQILFRKGISRGIILNLIISLSLIFIQIYIYMQFIRGVLKSISKPEDKQIRSLNQQKTQNNNQKITESIQKYVAKLLVDQDNFNDQKIKSIVDAILQQNLSKVKSIITPSMTQEIYIKKYQQKIKVMIDICQRKQWGQIDNLLLGLERMKQENLKKGNKKISKQIVSQKYNAQKLNDHYNEQKPHDVIKEQTQVTQKNRAAFKPLTQSGTNKKGINEKFHIKQEEQYQEFKQVQNKQSNKNSLKKKIYMLVKLKERISLFRSNGLSKIQLCSNNDIVYIPKQIGLMLKYNLIQFILPKASQNQSYYLRYLDQNENQYHSDKIVGKYFDQQINFLITGINYKLITKKVSQDYRIEIENSCLVQNILMLCILGKESLFKDLFYWLEQKSNIKSDLIQQINNFQGDDCFKNIKKLYRQKKWRQNIIPYVLANIYTFKKESFKSQKQGYIEKYFLYQVQYNQIQPMPLLKEYENILRRCILQIYYIYSKQNYKVSELFNELLRYSPRENINFLMRIIYDSRTANRKFKLANVDKKKLKTIMLGLRGYIPIIEYIYYFLLCLDIINNNRKVVIFNYIIELIAQLDFQHQQLEVIENTKNQQYHIHACKQLLNFFYKENYFQFNENNDDFIRFYLYCAKLPNKYKNIFVTPSLVQKTKYFIKTHMKIKNVESLQLLKVIFIQCQTLELLYPHLFQGFIIDFFYKNIPSKYYRESTNVLIKLDSKILEYFVEQIIAQFYIKKKYSSDDKFRVLNELIKELNLFSFEEIFTILDKGIQRFNTTNKQHIFLINYLFTNIFKNLMVKQSNLYQNLIINKKWLFFFKLNQFSKQYLIQKLITQATNLDKYNYKDTNSMIDMINDTVLNTYYLTEQQKDQIINLICIINNQSSIDLTIFKNVLYERPHLALTYTRCLDRGKISITTKIKGTVNQLKTELKEKKVTYKNIKKVYQYGQSIWQKLSKLFDCVGEKNLKTSIQQLYKQCQNFIAHLQMISKISKFFEFKVSKLINLSAINTFSAFINMEKNLDFELSQMLQPFSNLKSEVNKYIGIKYFRNIIPDKQPTDATQFVTHLNQSMNQFVQTVNRICSKYLKQQLRLNELQEITNNQNKKDIKEILKINIDMSDQHINELIYVTEKVTQFNEFLILYETLENILNYYEQQKINLIQLRDIFNNVKQQKYNQIEVYKTYHKIHDFQKILNGYQLKLNNKQDQINKVIKLTKFTKPLEGIWNMLDRISVQKMEQIKNYLISMHHQSTFCSYQLMMTMFQYVYNYYHTLIKNSMSFCQYLQKLTTFLSANNVSQKVSLQSSILSLTNYFNIFERYLSPNPQQKEVQLLQNISYLKNKQNQYLCSISKMKQQINQYKHTGYSQSKIIQQQQQKIKTLKQQNITLKKRVEVLEKQNKQLMVNNKVEQQNHIKQLNQKSSEIENLHILLKQKDRIISQYKSEVENQNNKLIQADSMIQKYKKQIEVLQNQISRKQKDQEIIKIRLQESTKKIKEVEIELDKYYQNYNSLQTEKTAITNKHKKEIEVLRTIINNISRYQKSSFIKQGGQAYIYLCEDKEEKQIQKKKKILRICSLEEKFHCLDIEKTLKQPQILSGLDHPNIIKIQKYWEYESYFMESRKPIHSISMVLEYIQGGDLSGYIGKLNRFQIKKIYKDIQSALNYLHSKNIIHRDIASKNILLKNVDKPSITAILTDLGISTLLQQYNGAHVTQKFFASSYYTPPQFGDDGQVTIKNDLWSLGVVMLQITLGKKINEFRPKTKKYLADYEDFPMKQLEMLKTHKDNSVFVEVISMLMKKDPSERTMIQL